MHTDKTVIFRTTDIDVLSIWIEQSTITTLGATWVESIPFKKRKPIRRYKKIEQLCHVNSRDLRNCSRILVTKPLGFQNNESVIYTKDINLNLHYKIQSTFYKCIWNFKPSKVKHIVSWDYI